MASLFQPRLATVMPPEEAESMLVLPGTQLVFDHLYNRLCQISLGEHREVRGSRDAEGSFSVSGDVRDDPGEAGYKAMVEKIKAMLHQGEAIQVVPSVNFSVACEGDPFVLYRRMRRYNASPYMFFMRLADFCFWGASPEVMVRCQKGRLQLSPIAGTRRRGRDDLEDARLAEELRSDPKEQAEHVMLVDLARNDMGRISEFGTVKVTDFMNVRNYSHVMHIVSMVEGRKKGSYHPFDLLASFLPAGTLSGAPKIRAMEIIEELEEVRRGLYGGATGYVDFSGDMDFCITIRTMIKKGREVYLQAGAGIVADSVPEKEYQECCNKVMALARTLLEEENL